VQVAGERQGRNILECAVAGMTSGLELSQPSVSRSVAGQAKVLHRRGGDLPGGDIRSSGRQLAKASQWAVLVTLTVTIS
jgi:hypothetical protein